jgi:hypothetical protein
MSKSYPQHNPQSVLLGPASGLLARKIQPDFGCPAKYLKTQY